MKNRLHLRSELTMEESIQSLHQEVERRLGRCLLMLQKYEHLVKALVIYQGFAGAITETASILKARDAGVASKTLGALVRELVGGYLVSNVDEEAKPDRPPESFVGIHVSFRARLQMTPDDLQRTEAGMRDLVALRNHLVHHFIRQHDLRTIEGCRGAKDALYESEIRVERELEQVKVWVQDMFECLRAHACHLQSKEFEDWLVDGIAPDGSVDWNRAGVVRELLKAARAISSDTWAPVHAAAHWIAERFPEQQPAKYGCRSWREVIDRSRRFELSYREIDGERVACYRPRNTTTNKAH